MKSDNIVEYVDKNHRIEKIEEQYYPEFRPYFFRFKLTSNIFSGCWLKYTKKEKIKILNNEITIQFNIFFHNIENAKCWLKHYKIKKDIIG